MGDWVSEFPNDNPELFSQHPPGSDESSGPMSLAQLAEAVIESSPQEEIEVVDAFDEADFINATLESIVPPAPEPEPLMTDCDQLAPSAEEPEPESIEMDHWRIYMDALREVASSFGAPAAVVAGMALTLEADPVARMWRVAINGG